MGSPAIIQNDKVTGSCPNHLIPNPTSGAPQPAPPMPFSAPLLQGLIATVLIHGLPAAVVGSSGYNTPPHVGLHPSDPFLVPTQEVGRITSGSPTVSFGGQPAATAQSACALCASAGSVVPSVNNVLIG